MLKLLNFLRILLEKLGLSRRNNWKLIYVHCMKKTVPLQICKKFCQKTLQIYIFENSDYIFQKTCTGHSVLWKMS